MWDGKLLDKGIRQVVFVIILFGLLFLIIKETGYFLSSILGAFTIYMLLRSPHKKLLAKGWNKTLATSFLLSLTVIIVFILGGGFLTLIYNKVKDFQPHLVIDNFNGVHDFILLKTGFNIFSKDVVNKAIQSLTKMLPDVFAATGSVVANALMMIFILFFMLQESRRMETGIENNLPFSKESVLLLKKETQSMVVSNAIGIPLILIGQALVGAIGYWILGAGDPIVWGLLTGIFGLIPIIGTAGIWVPLAINLFLGGNTWQAVVLIIYGALVISSIDNLIRMVFMKRYANVHPLITLFGIILGMNLFGFWGIIFGPLVLSGSMLLFKIYKTEFAS